MSNPDIIVYILFPGFSLFQEPLTEKSFCLCLHSLPTDPIYPQTPWPCWCCVLVQRAPSWVQFSPSSFRSFPTLHSTRRRRRPATLDDLKSIASHTAQYICVYVLCLRFFLIDAGRSPKEPRRVSFLYPSKNTLFCGQKKTYVTNHPSQIRSTKQVQKLYT